MMSAIIQVVNDETEPGDEIVGRVVLPLPSIHRMRSGRKAEKDLPK